MNDIIDMSQFVEAKSDQLNADDLIGAPRTITVRKVTGNDGDQPVSIFYEGDDNKPFKPCKTMRRVLLAIWGRNAADYVGRAMTVYRDDSVIFGGLNVGGIRISHMSHMDKEAVVVVMKTKGKKAGIKVLPLAQRQTAAPKQTAEQWASAHIAEIQSAENEAVLAEIIASGARAVAKLQTANPDLAERIAQAVAARRGQFGGEGRADTDHGGQFTEAELGTWEE